MRAPLVSSYSSTDHIRLPVPKVTFESGARRRLDLHFRIHEAGIPLLVRGHVIDGSCGA